MALRLKDPEVFSHFCWSRFKILDLKKLTICLFIYIGKHIFMMKYYGKSLLLSLVKSGYNNEVDSKLHDETNMPVFFGSFKSQKLKITYISYSK